KSHVTYDVAENVAGLRAERHADADFARAAGDGKGNNAGKTEGGQQRGEKAEEAGKPGEQALLGERVVDLDFERRGGVEREVGVEVANLCANEVVDFFWIAGSAHLERHIKQALFLRH